MKHSLTRFFHRWQGKTLLVLLLAAALMLPAQNGLAGTKDAPCNRCSDDYKGFTYTYYNRNAHYVTCNNCYRPYMEGEFLCDIVSVTCTRASICTVCLHEYSVPLGHDYKAAVTAPTCTAQGYTTHTCSRGDSTYTDTFTPALGHDYKSTVTAPTCTTEGKTIFTCTRCKDTYTTAQPALGHDLRYDAARSKAPACVVKGLEAYTCARCGQRQDKVLPWLVHRYGPWAPDGEGHTAACVVCGEPKTVPCEFTERKVGDAALRLCGVCGQGSFGSQAFTAPMVENASYNRLRLSYAPKNGELVIRRLALPGSADALYIVLLEVGGVSVPTTGAVRVTLPVAGEGTFALAQLGADLSPTEIPFTQQEGNLVFDTYLPGLFLLQAAGK